MLNHLFNGIYGESITNMTPSTFLISVLVSLILGAGLMLTYIYKTSYTKSFAVTMAMLPAIVCVVIMMVSGNLGAGVAVAGTFSLVRFRSVPGTAKEIGAIFMAMAVGLITGMGYLGYASLFAIMIGAINILYSVIRFGEKDMLLKSLRVTIPEDLDYGNIFDDLFEEYTDEHRLISVKTSNLGSLYKIAYEIKLKDESMEKQLIDQMRCRNGNLEISVSMQESVGMEL